MPFRLGIDLGTTYCVLSVIDSITGNPVVLKNTEGTQIIPSAVYFRDGQYMAGLDAKDRFEDGDKNCAMFFKRSMGEKENGVDTICFTAEKGTPYERGYTAVELSALLLMHLKQEAESIMGDTVLEAVITCPAYFYANERDCIMRAAAFAGLKIQEILEEPTAAALAYGLRNWQAGTLILVYDLGGGTFDVSVVEMDDRLRLKVKGTMGRKFLGGKDFDDALARVAVRKLASAAGIDPKYVSDEEKAAIRVGMEKLKHRLTDTETVGGYSGIVGGQSYSVDITRSGFEAECAYILDDTGILIDQLLEKFGIERDEISDVLLVGGSTYMPCVRTYIQKLFGRPPITRINPNTAVSVGAALRTLEVRGGGVGETWKKKTPSDITEPIGGPVVARERYGEISTVVLVTHTLGVIARNREGTEYVNQHIIPAGDQMPCKYARKFKYYTSKKAANELEIYVLQGESLKPGECKPQFRYIVKGIRHVVKGDTDGTLIRVQYSYDKNGLIYVQARQEDDDCDLPIERREVPADMSKYSKPIGQVQPGRKSPLLGIQFDAVNQDVVSKYRTITFSNVEWVKYDYISYHPAGLANEPSIHLAANEKAIEFNGYTVSEMNEGVYYVIGADDSFEIDCHIDTSQIQPHPGGQLSITLGIITATLNQHGGQMMLDKKTVADVGSRFHLKMSVTNGMRFEVFIDGKSVGSMDKKSEGNIEVRFGFTHYSHCCNLLSYAYVSNIGMKQSGGESDEDSPTESWKATWEE